MNTKVNLAGVELKNPVMTASGTFGSGAEYSEFVDLNRLGAVVTKGVANVPWPGNPTPRIAEVYGGMLNAIGLQNPGIDVFVKRDIPFLKQYDPVNSEHTPFFRHFHELPVGAGLGEQIQDALNGIFRLQAVRRFADNVHCLGLITA